jgi:hypothetical protein
LLVSHLFLIPPSLFLASLGGHAPGICQACVLAVFAVAVLGFRRLVGALAIRQNWPPTWPRASSARPR